MHGSERASEVGLQKIQARKLSAANTRCAGADSFPDAALRSAQWAGTPFDQRAGGAAGSGVR